MKAKILSKEEFGEATLKHAEWAKHRDEKAKKTQSGILKVQQRHPYIPQDSGIIDPVYNCILGVIPPWNKYNNILDIGCNYGDFTNRIKERFKPKKIIGLELSSYIAEEASKRYEDIEFATGNILSKEFGRMKFDLIMASGVLNIQHLTNTRVYEEVIYRVSKLLKRKGYFVEQNNINAMKGFKEECDDILEKYFDVSIHLDFYHNHKYTPDHMPNFHSAKHRWVKLCKLKD